MTSEHPLHEITIDEDLDNDGKKFCAFCTDECGWQGLWYHEDEFAPLYPDPDDAAMLAAEDQGDEHLRDEGIEPPQ